MLTRDAMFQLRELNTEVLRINSLLDLTPSKKVAEHRVSVPVMYCA